MIGHSYHAVKADLAFVLTAFPADRPVPPPSEKTFIINPDLVDAEVQKHINNVSKLQQLVEQLQTQIDETVEEEVNVIHVDGEIPDAERESVGMEDEEKAVVW